MSAITSHVLDTATGKPAAGVAITLYLMADSGGWAKVAQRHTDADGRVGDLLSEPAIRQAGTYRLRFAVAEYFAAEDTPGFYPYVDVVFLVRPGQHYHVPLLVSPFGYSTYRGS